MIRREDYEMDIKEKTIPSSTVGILQASSDPKRLSKLGMTRGQMLQYGLNMKSAEEEEDEMESRLRGTQSGGIQSSGGQVQGSFNRMMNIGEVGGLGGRMGELEKASMRLGEAASQRRIGEMEKEQEIRRGSLSIRPRSITLGTSSFNRI
jgi:hypothetical protein